MKKNLLFIIPSLSSGGAEKSLITLLGLLDYSKYDVDLFLFRREGLFLSNVPQKVNIIDGGDNYKNFDSVASDYIKSCFLSLKIGKAFNRIKYSQAIKNNDRKAMWDCLKKALPSLKKHYDTAIAYLEGNSIYYCADCVDAKVKIGYIHSDYDKLEMDRSFDEGIFSRMDYVVGVSEKCVEVLCKNFPQIKEKFRAVENITSPTALKKMSDGYPEEYSAVQEPILLTVGRLCQPKGYDIAVDAAEILDKKGVDFKWFAIGKGELKAELEQKIREKNLQEKFILLGERANPYPYISNCDIYVQSSHYEGKSIAIDEAKCFAKPIVTTKFTTVFDQLEDNKTALLAEINAKSVAEKITQLINSKELCERLSNTLRQTHKGNEEELIKFYSLIE